MQTSLRQCIRNSPTHRCREGLPRKLFYTRLEAKTYETQQCLNYMKRHQKPKSEGGGPATPKGMTHCG